MSGMFTRPKCRTCGAELSFVRTRATGRLMPVNYGMDPKGNIAATRVGRSWVDAHVITDAEPLKRGETPFTAHWKTCTDPDKHRKPRTPAPTREPAPKGTPDRPAPVPTLFD